MEQFIELQAVIDDSLTLTLQRTRRSFWSPSFWMGLYYKANSLIYMLLFAGIFLPHVWRYLGFILTEISHGIGNHNIIILILTIARMIIFGLSALFWIFATFRPAVWIAKHFTKWRLVIYVIQSLFVTPLSWLGVMSLFSIITGSSIEALAPPFYEVSIVVIVASALAILMAFAGSLLSTSVPSIGLLLFTGPAARTFFNAIPSHDAIAEQALRDTTHLMEDWSAETVQQVDIVAQYKGEGLAAQVQAIAPLLGAIGLVSVFTVVISQEQIQDVLHYLSIFFSQLSGESSAIGVYITAFLGLLIILGCLYFIRTYRMMRILEIVRVACSMRLAELQRQQEAVQQAETARLLAAHHTRSFRERLADWLRGAGR